MLFVCAHRTSSLKAEISLEEMCDKDMHKPCPGQIVLEATGKGHTGGLALSSDLALTQEMHE